MAVQFIINHLEAIMLIHVIRDKTLGRFDYPIEIRRIHPIFERDIKFVSIIKDKLKPVLQDLKSGEMVKVIEIFDNLDLNDIDKVRVRNLILFALKDFKSSGSIELYKDQYLGFAPGDLENSNIQKL